jgi:hypothetical protein
MNFMTTSLGDDGYRLHPSIIMALAMRMQSRRLEVLAIPIDIITR